MHLVTGGAGYLGSRIARRLLDRGEAVRILDIQRSKYLPEPAELVQADMRDPEACRAAVRGVDTLFHTAFVQSFSRLDEATQREIDIGGTENLLVAAHDAGVRRLVHTSTIEIYGTRPPRPCPESAPVDPVGIYGRLKWECEELIRDSCAKTGLPFSMLRMPTICGPGFYNHKPLLMLLDRILDGRTVAVVGDGATVGDFVHVDDVVDAFLLASSREDAVGEAFNVSCSTPATHEEMVRAAIDAAESRSRVLHIPAPLVRTALRTSALLGRPLLPPEQYGYLFHDNRYDISKARARLGFEPRYSATEAMRALTQGYRDDRKFLRERTC